MVLFPVCISLKDKFYTFLPHELVLCPPELVEGKNKRLILNNIENKLLKIICAVVNSGTAYTENYKTINPELIKTA
ncbi:MAG: hypothetical protein M5U17_12620 [Ignavibacterium sp.]|nr:hypothetical protein [Ignavibacterium sp.]